jgi:glycosyltransferase involved in cell wall biosynthesis
MPISCLILTRNEEINIGACLRLLSWSDDIVVLDSQSTDGTVEIARSLGARVVQRAFDGYASQRNYGLKNIRYQHDWLLLVDADERIPEDLRDEMLQGITETDDSVTVFCVRGKNFLFGRWIAASSGYPTWFARLVRPERVWFERDINEELHTDGEWRPLRAQFLHYPFNKGFSAWIAKHNLYSTMEAELLVRERAAPLLLKDIVDRDPRVRRRAVKSLLYRLPGRPLIVFMSLYFFRGGFLEGRAGLTYVCLRVMYEFMIDCKCVELRRRGRGLPT